MRYQLDRLDGVESVNSEVVGGVEMRAKLGTSVNVVAATTLFPGM